VTGVPARSTATLRLVVSNDALSDTMLLSMMARLSPARRRLVAAAIAQIGEVEDDAREAEACAILDRVMATLRTG
jgi:hypothetical protein